METKTIIIEEKQERLDKYLSEVLDNISRERVKNLTKDGLITVNGNIVKVKKTLMPGDKVEINIPETIALDVVAQEMDLDVVFEDDFVILINKDSGVVVHPAPGHPDGTLVNGLMHHCKDLSGINGIERPGVVHRIDKDTSGVLMFAKNDIAHRGLAKQLEDKSATRKYVALVHGVIQHETGTINAPIGREKNDRKKMTVTADNSKSAVSHFKVLERFDKFTLIELKLETGRTHQIRVHMAYIEHPIVSDPAYGRKKDNDPFGQYLHAKTLGFVHPDNGQYMEFSTELHPKFIERIEEIRRSDNVK